MRATSINGLAAPGLDPWHIRATYQLYDHTGQPEPQGTFEEFWLSPTRFKRTFSSPQFSETELSTDRGLYRVGDHDWPNKSEFLIHDSLISPIPGGIGGLGLHLGKKSVSLGTANLECLTLQSPGVMPIAGAYCFEPTQPMLRITVSSNGQSQTEYSDIVLFEGQYIARTIRSIDRGKIGFSLHVDLIEPLAVSRIPDLTVPAAAIPIVEPISLPQIEAPNLLILQLLPVYPPMAKLSHI
ncbi:MAG: hypothetical protein KGL02_13565, partial [Acidobacteriota bacterium]|nr:hypothetical protein [Acidobacteriota bacterium]